MDNKPKQLPIPGQPRPDGSRRERPLSPKPKGANDPPIFTHAVAHRSKSQRPDSQQSSKQNTQGHHQRPASPKSFQSNHVKDNSYQQTEVKTRNARSSPVDAGQVIRTSPVDAGQVIRTSPVDAGQVIRTSPVDAGQEIRTTDRHNETTTTDSEEQAKADHIQRYLSQVTYFSLI